jgi:hypothetical protein
VTPHAARTSQWNRCSTASISPSNTRFEVGFVFCTLEGSGLLLLKKELVFSA